MDIISGYGLVFLALACVFGLFMAWGIGANDVANAMGTSVGSRALTLKQAILVAAVFEFLGAYLAGGEVTSTIRKGIIDPELLTDSPQLLVYGMLAALLAAATWLAIASKRGWPVSTTHSIVGAIVGFAAVGISVDAVAWGKVGTIAMSWVVSPLLAGSIAFALFVSVKRLILEHEDTFQRAVTYIPMYMFLVGFMICMVTLLKGLKHVGLDVDMGMGSKFTNAMVVSTFVGAGVAAFGALLLRRVTKVQGDINSTENVERVFGILMIFTACAMAMAQAVKIMRMPNTLSTFSVLLMSPWTLVTRRNNNAPNAATPAPTKVETTIALVNLEPIPMSTSNPTCFRPFNKVTMQIMKPTKNIYIGM